MLLAKNLVLVVQRWINHVPVRTLGVLEVSTKLQELRVVTTLSSRDVRLFF